MCLFYALRIWWHLGGEVYLQLFPLHILLKIKGQMVHGTNRYHFWHVEYASWSHYLSWKNSGFHPIVRII